MSNGIDFVIGGKDQAKPAMSSVEQSLSRLEAKTNALGVATSGLTKLTGGLVAVWAAMKSAMAIIGGIEAINSAYDDAAQATSDLNVALKLQGVNVDAESARLQSFADEIQKLTGINDDATLSLMRQAALLGTSADQLDDMAQAAIGLAEATGSDTTSAMRMLRQATEGHFDSLNKAIPALRTMTTDEEKLAAVLELSARGFEAKSTWSNKVAESGAHASTALDKVMESVGALIAPFRVLLSSGLEALAKSLTNMLAPAVEIATKTLEELEPAMQWLKQTITALLATVMIFAGIAIRNLAVAFRALVTPIETAIDKMSTMERVIQFVKDVTVFAIEKIVAAFTWFEVIALNLDSVWLLIESRTELAMRQIGETIMHTVTEVIPAYVMWFGENIINMFKDAFNGVVTVVMNASQNIVEIIREMVTFIFVDMGSGFNAMGDRIAGILSRSLLTGFESALTDLPDIAARTITDREAQLAETIGTVGANLGDEFNKKFSERMVGVGDGLDEEFSKNIDLKVNSAVDDALGKPKRPGSGKGEQSINAMESRLLTRGPANTYEAQMLALTLRGTEVLKVIGDRMQMTKEELKNVGAKLENNAILAVPVQ